MSENEIEETLICVNCPKGCRIEVEAEGDEIINMDGYECALGRDYAIEEFKNPTRILPTTVRVKGGVLPLVPVKSEDPLPKNKIGRAMRELAEVEVPAPVQLGQTVKSNVAGTDVDMVATRTVKKDGSSTPENKTDKRKRNREKVC
ncbi:DUF1667 domain-containing protein [Halarsenatibacter silvermanii]|uniref:CxxC motif-containing protein n=1 Tax=Halarsenatibacter silvermanii TaxID=321763 RepID=A0A1G9LJ96_9FIRM|nr:DUF1667 domain-containing protein [Halarsenatibacter silvermanii]SDL62009.1 CxxC motif-containing protein [Halarsenatibacter silvermanii]